MQENTISTKEFTTDQESFWAGEFGNEYVDRNNDPDSIARRTAVFSKILSNTIDVQSIIEFGSNIGHNIYALKNLLPGCRLSAIEINEKAIERLKKIDSLYTLQGSILEIPTEEIGQHDLTFTSGVLIHINPDKLSEVYTKLYNCSNKYIMVREYYNRTPVEIDYRGNSGKLFKRDFAGEMLDLFPDLELVDYGFAYHRDNNFRLDDATWFLMRKKS